MKRIAALLALAVTVSSCALFKSTGPSPSDSVAYEVVGANVTGTAQIIMATPTTQLIKPSPAGTSFVFLSDVIAGYGQFNNVPPNVTVIGFGCFDVDVIVNGVADKDRHMHDCGQPITVSSK